MEPVLVLAPPHHPYGPEGDTTPMREGSSNASPTNDYSHYCYVIPCGGHITITYCTPVPIKPIRIGRAQRPPLLPGGILLL